MMKKCIGLTLLLLAAIVFFCSCSNEQYSPTGADDPLEHTTDTLVVTYYDTVYVMVNDSTVDTIYISCDTCAFENCNTLGKNVHKVMWFKDGVMVVVNSNTPHARGHTIDICISLRQHDGEYEITLTAWRDKVKPDQTLNVYLNGQHTVWSLGHKQYSTLQL